LDIAGFPVLLVQGADGLRAYVNACPHQFLPLDWRSDRILSPDGRTLRCSNHDAGFDADTGAGLDGFAQGCALDPVPIEIHDGALRIAQPTP
jgi:nitrite reductase/ring-hydroxylating ferredoxin subunit